MYATWQEAAVDRILEGETEPGDYLHEYGLTPDIIAADPEEAVRRFHAFGFSKDELHLIIPLDDEVIDRLFDKLPAWLPVAIDLHLSYMTPADIAEEVGVVRGAVYYHLDRLDLEPHSTHPSPLDEDDKAVIVASVREGLPLTTIARALGRSYGQVSYFVRKLKEGS